ncbi:hypothetical protein T484DRAFT_1775527 [Baffinella frigidus]|nr:hypothetical protein T484DRAFT_1775527 [Cryptophyta sp. CCMP2293]
MSLRVAYRKAVRRLLDLGADPSKRDDANLTARDHAWYFLDKDGAEDINTTLAILNLCEPSPTSAATLKDATRCVDLIRGNGLSNRVLDGAEDINTTLAILNLCEPSPTSVATLKDALPSFPESAMVRHAPQREDKLLPDVGNEVTEEELEGPVAPGSEKDEDSVTEEELEGPVAPESEEDSVPEDSGGPQVKMVEVVHSTPTREEEEDSVLEDSGGPQVKMVECDLEGEGLGSGGHLPAFWDKSAWEKRRKAFSARSAEEKAEMEETRLLARKRKAEIAADEPQEEMPPAPMPLARRRGKAADEEGEWVDSEDPDDFDYRGSVSVYLGEWVDSEDPDDFDYRG